MSNTWDPPIFEEEIQKARECHAIIQEIRQLADQQFAATNSVSNLVNAASI